MSTSDPKVVGGWYNGDEDRNSFDILWSCLATIFACTYTVLHMPTPLPHTRKRTVFWQKLRLLGLTAIAPEAVTASAAGESIYAKKCLTCLKAADVGADDWTMAQMFYCNMGSVYLATSDNYLLPFLASNEFSVSDRKFTLLTPHGAILDLLKEGRILLPQITKQDTEDRSKADNFSKLFTLLQGTWFAINSIARLALHLTLTPLEISCLAFILCTGVTYLCWWNKPKDVLSPSIIPIPLAVGDLPENLRKETLFNGQTNGDEKPPFWTQYSREEILLDCGFYTRRTSLTVLLIGVAFGCIHAGPWYFEFPTEAERLIWRVCSIVSIGSFIVFCACLELSAKLEGKYKIAVDEFFAALCIVGGFIYAISRAFLIALTFSCLRKLPPGCFIGINWALRLPHV